MSDKKIGERERERENMMMRVFGSRVYKRMLSTSTYKQIPYTRVPVAKSVGIDVEEGKTSSCSETSCFRSTYLIAETQVRVVSLWIFQESTVL